MLTGSGVGGNIQIKQDGAARINRVRVDGNLQCKANEPAPTGGGNSGDGNTEDRCRRL